MFLKKNKPVIRERDDHCISRANMDADAVKVLYRLVNSNYISYLVGGSVRDMLLGREPKDFDISTDAQPAQIRKLFRNCFLIGRRFRLAHIVFGRKVIETSTFRAQPKAVKGEDGLYQAEDNTFGTPEEDAKRRDFTVNGLFYDIKTFSVIDYVGGLKDLERKMIRSIGDPNVRFREDPVRMMRAIKFAAKLDFFIEKNCRKALKTHHADILNASVPRVCDEVYRLFTVNASEAAFKMMWEFNLLEVLLPDVSEYINRSGKLTSPLWRYLAALDSISTNNEFSNGIRTAVLYYPIFLEQCEKDKKQFPNGRINRMQVARKVLRNLSTNLHIPKAVFFSAVAAMDMVPRFDNMPSKTRAARFARNSSFRESYDFKEILLTADGGDLELLEQWKQLHLEAYDDGANSSDVTESSTRRKRHHQSRGRRKRSKPNE
ncbi:MAG: polynucleotide adenylyltransferase PcnB [Kiritimatiellae bacterium]|jgi:poly(A) polymerase|nr:polynucleotide adenylyltransferase PcnB [Kiritimatiellia bacterium]